MECSRCHGLMIEDYSLETYAEDDTPIEAWRCLNCGEIVDAVITQNRVREIVCVVGFDVSGPALLGLA